MIDIINQIQEYNNKEKDKNKLERKLRSHKNRKQEEEKLIDLLQNIIDRESNEIEEMGNEIIAKVRLGDLIDELTTCTGITQYKIYISMTPTTISGNYTKEKIVKEKLNHFQKIYIYIRGMDKIDEENFQTYFKYDLNLPINLLEIQGNGKQLIDCCTLIIKENKLAKDSLETSLKIEKESEQDIICNLTIKELVILSKKINQPQLNTLNKAINHCIENKENYNNPKQMRKEK